MSLPPITLTGHAQKKAWQNKVLPHVEQLGRDVWSIHVPFPDNPMRYTLSYLLMGWMRSFLECTPFMKPERFTDTEVFMVRPGEDRWTPLDVSLSFF